MNKLFFDIETAPAPESRLQELNNLYEKKKNQYSNYPKTFDDYVLQTSFSGGLGILVCICYAINDGETVCISGDESQQLIKFWEVVKQVDLLIGHNILDFDLPFLKKKSVVLGVKYPDISLRRYSSSPVFDTLQEWNCWGRSDGFSSLDALASTFGFQTSKTELDGSKVAQYYKEGRVDEIINYCKADIELTRKIYQKMIFEHKEEKQEKLVKNSKLF